MGRFKILLSCIIAFVLLAAGCSPARPVEGDGPVPPSSAQAISSRAALSSGGTGSVSETASAPSQASQSFAGAGSTEPPGTSGSAPEPPDQPDRSAVGEASSLPAGSKMEQTGEMRAVWISYYELDGRGKDRNQFAAMAGDMLDRVKALGLNTVVVHVRANSDAFYPSSYFPWSEYAAGTQGQDPGYDPLSILIEAAHARGLAFHAWLNPYRVSNKTGNVQDLAENNPARVYLTDGDPANDDWAVSWENGIYYNPGVVQTQKLILDGVREILDSYQVDGVHFDDYFYPTTDPAFDQKAYGSYKDQAGDRALSLGDWRRANVNGLMQAVYRLCDSRGVPFGISPAAHVSTDGSDQNYQELYADVALWMRSGGYAHYITPQLYFGFDYPKADYRFDALLQRWLSLPRSQNVRLYIGLPSYKIGTEDAGSAEWKEKTDVLSRQLTLLRQHKADGFMLYSYGSVVSTAELNQAQMQAFLNALG